MTDIASGRKRASDTPKSGRDDSSRPFSRHADRDPDAAIAAVSVQPPFVSATPAMRLADYNGTGA